MNANLRGITRIDGDNFHDIKGGNISLEVNNVNIGPYTFYTCNASINISGTIQSIGNEAFDYCNKTIIELYNSSIITIDNNPCSRGYRPTIYVLPSLVEKYNNKGIYNAEFHALSDN